MELKQKVKLISESQLLDTMLYDKEKFKIMYLLRKKYLGVLRSHMLHIKSKLFINMSYVCINSNK